MRHKYYVDRNVVPLIYYILATNAQQLDKFFEFLYNENFITTCEDST